MSVTIDSMTPYDTEAMGKGRTAVRYFCSIEVGLSDGKTVEIEHIVEAFDTWDDDNWTLTHVLVDHDGPILNGPDFAEAVSGIVGRPLKFDVPREQESGFSVFVPA